MDFEYAGFWRRFAALIIDGIILLIFNSVIIAIFSRPFMGYSRTGSYSAAGTSIVYILLAVSSWL